jgi:hypothetical protein
MKSVDMNAQVRRERRALCFSTLSAHGTRAEIESQHFSHFVIHERDMFRTIAIIEPKRQRNAAASACLRQYVEEQAMDIRVRHFSIF